MSYLIIAAQFILSLSILIVLHEMGHFLPARWFKTRVEKFYLFFDPWFHIFEKKVGETRYGIGWVPLGGYVKISGMVDESMDKEQMMQPPQPWEFRSKKAWQRLIIMLGGVTVNFILGLFLMGMILFVWGDDYVRTQDAKFGISITDSIGYRMGLQDGDLVLSVGGEKCEEVSPKVITKAIVIHNAHEMVVLRNGQEVKLPIAENFIDELSTQRKSFFEIRTPFVVDSVIPNMAAASAGIMKGDSLVGMGQDSTMFYHDFVKAFSSSKGQALKLLVWRNGGFVDVNVTPDGDGKIGAFSASPLKYIPVQHRNYSLLEAFPAGIAKGWNFLGDQITAFGQIFKGKIKAQNSLGGFGTIASMYSPVWDWQSFWNMTAILSLILAFMNLLPIPALDGGHVMFLLYEMITGKQPNEKFMEYAQLTGMILILGLILFANGMDLFRLFKG